MIDLYYSKFSRSRLIIGALVNQYSPLLRSACPICIIAVNEW